MPWQEAVEEHAIVHFKLPPTAENLAESHCIDKRLLMFCDFLFKLRNIMKEGSQKLLSNFTKSWEEKTELTSDTVRGNTFRSNCNSQHLDIFTAIWSWKSVLLLSNCLKTTVNKLRLLKKKNNSYNLPSS